MNLALTADALLLMSLQHKSRLTYLSGLLSLFIPFGFGRASESALSLCCRRFLVFRLPNHKTFPPFITIRERARRSLQPFARLFILLLRLRLGGIWLIAISGIFFVMKHQFYVSKPIPRLLNDRIFSSPLPTYFDWCCGDGVLYAFSKVLLALLCASRSVKDKRVWWPRRRFIRHRVKGKLSVQRQEKVICKWGKWG